MSSTPIVLMDPGFEMKVSFCRVLAEPGAAPLPDSGSDEAFGVAVGAWRIDAAAAGALSQMLWSAED